MSNICVSNFHVVLNIWNTLCIGLGKESLISQAIDSTNWFLEGEIFVVAVCISVVIVLEIK